MGENQPCSPCCLRISAGKSSVTGRYPGMLASSPQSVFAVWLPLERNGHGGKTQPCSPCCLRISAGNSSVTGLTSSPQIVFAVLLHLELFLPGGCCFIAALPRALTESAVSCDDLTVIDVAGSNRCLTPTGSEFSAALRRPHRNRCLPLLNSLPCGSDVCTVSFSVPGWNALLMSMQRSSKS